MSKERPNRAELDPHVLSAYIDTFINRRDLYHIQLPNGTYAAVNKSLTDNMVAAHLKGYITIGAYSLDTNGWAKWLCLDSDDEQYWQRLVNLASELDSLSVPSYLEPSRRGGHLWLFTDPIPGFQIRRFGKQLLSEHELPLKKRKQLGIELYPKQDKPITGPGSLVRLPLGVHRLSGRRYHFITPLGAPLAPSIREQLAILGNPNRVPQAFIDELLARAPEPRKVSPTPQFRPTHDRDMSGPPSERIKQAISVYDFVSQYVELDQRGKGYCPFHDDQVQSFQVSREGNYWHCYAGCEGQTIIDFWMLWREKHHKKGDFKSAVKDLAKMLL
jgi:hypothetical protein